MIKSLGFTKGGPVYAVYLHYSFTATAEQQGTIPLEYMDKKNQKRKYNNTTETNNLH